MADLFQTGVQALQQKQLPKAIQLLEQYCQSDSDPLSSQVIQAQMYLVRAYKESGLTQQAIAFCRKLIASNHPKAQAWARKALTHLTVGESPSIQTPPSQTPTQVAQPPTAQQQIDHSSRLLTQVAVLEGAKRKFDQQRRTPSKQQAPDVNKFKPKSDDDFNRFFDAKLLPTLKVLDKQRYK